MPFEYRFPRPALTVDCAVFSPADDALDVLLVERREEPFAGTWATPGGFVEIEEPIDEAASRELAEETGMTGVELDACGVFGEPGRDPRGRIVAVAHWALVDAADHELEAASDAADLQWFSVDDLPELAFDHAELIDGALGALRRRARTAAIGRQVLRAPFSLEEACDLWEVVLQTDVPVARAERVLVEETGLLTPVDGEQTPDPTDAAYRFDDEVYERLAGEPLSRLLPPDAQ